jgi:hypothetical protein
MDVKSAFVNGELGKEVYVRQSPDFCRAGHKEKVLIRLRKAFYGLHQASIVCNVKLNRNLGKLSFTLCISEDITYTRGVGASCMVMALYVDDPIITSISSEHIGVFKGEMRRLFDISDWLALILPWDYKVEQRRDVVTLS